MVEGKPKTTAEGKPVDATNWADMGDNEEDDDQEIGVQQPTTTAAANQEEQKEGATPAEGGDAAQTTAEGGKPYRKKKDYGDKYNPNYRKERGPWRKGQAPVAAPGTFNPPAPREKTARGDYVVTSFQIPDRVPSKADKVSYRSQFSIDLQ